MYSYRVDQYPSGYIAYWLNYFQTTQQQQQQGKFPFPSSVTGRPQRQPVTRQRDRKCQVVRSSAEGVVQPAAAQLAEGEEPAGEETPEGGTEAAETETAAGETGDHREARDGGEKQGQGG